MEIRLSGKRSLVTGGNSGLGRAIALELARAGADVVVNYVTHPEAAEEVARQVSAAGVRALAVEADVSNSDAVDAMFRLAERAWGGIDILVNNAGIDGARAFAWEIDPAAFRRVLEIDLFGAFLCCREALSGMVARKSGVIVNVTSVHEKIPWSGYTAYCAAKAGLSMLTKTLAQEAAPFGVRVLAIAPGAIKTAINRDVWENPATLADLLTKIPNGRMGEPEEIGRLVVALASDAASYVTGATVFADGGMTLYPSFREGG